MEYEEFDDERDYPPTSLLTGSTATLYKLDLRGVEPGGQYSGGVQAMWGGKAGKWSGQVTVSNGKRSKSTSIKWHSGVLSLLVPPDHHFTLKHILIDIGSLFVQCLRKYLNMQFFLFYWFIDYTIFLSLQAITETCLTSKSR